MKKILVPILVLFSCVLWSQTRLNSHPLELKKSKANHQILSTFNPNTKAVFVIASDKENVKLLKFNETLFFEDSLTVKRPDEAYKNLTGYSFGADENPTAYWTSNDFKKIVAVHYDLAAKKTTSQFYALAIVNETILQVFNENNSFYILSQKSKTDQLVLYVFKDSKKEEHVLDFGSFSFYFKNKEKLTFQEVLEAYPLEKIETRSYNPLFKGTNKSKFYVREKEILLSLDHNFKETQLFEIDLKKYEIRERKIPQLPLKRRNGTSNSYYHENKLYQLTLNDEEFILSIRNYETTELLNNFTVSKTDTIAFKNSPLWSQIEGQKQQSLKNTAKFLTRLTVSNVGLTVYKMPKSLFLTIGGNRTIEQGFIDLSVVNTNLVDLIGIPLSQATNVYFESALDKNLSPLPLETEPLAVDFMSNYANQHPEVALQNSFKFKNYFIYGYYDTKEKQYVMLKFYDGF